MLGLSKNSADVISAKHYKEGVWVMLNDPAQRAQLLGSSTPIYTKFKCSLVGEWNRDKGYVLQNMRVNYDGTVISTTQPVNVDKGDMILIFGKWWIVENVTFDLTSIAPQGDYWMPMKNAITQIRIRAIKANGVGKYD